MSVVIPLDGVDYEVPSGSSDTNWAAKHVAFQQAIARTINLSAALGVNVLGANVLREVDLATPTPADVTPTHIAAATATAIANGTRTIYLPAGDYSFDLSSITPGADNDDRLITVPSGITVRGDGYATHIHITGVDGGAGGDAGRNLFGLEEGATGVIFENIRFTGENGTLQHAPLGVVDFTYVNNNQSSAINFIGTSTADANSNCVVRSCFFENLWGFPVHGGGNTYDIEIVDNFVRWCANGFNVNGARINYSRNHIFYSEGIEVAGYDIAVSNNILNSPFEAGVVVGGQPVPGAIAHGNVITGNIITGAIGGAGGQGTGIVVSFEACATLVSGNTVRACTGRALSAGTGNGEMPSPPSRHIVVGNVFINNCDDSGDVGQVALVGVGGHTFIGNYLNKLTAQPDQSEDFDPSEAGLGSAYGLVLHSNDNFIDGNTFGASSQHVLVDSGFTGNRISPNNQFLGAGGEVQWAGSNSGDTIYGVYNSPAASHYMFFTRVNGDAIGTYAVRFSGLTEWGPGGGGGIDTNLYRSAANKLKTDDMMLADLGLGVGNSAAGSTPGTCVKKIEVFDAAGASLGFIPVYDAIT